jgi:hypothetical protein
MAVVQTGAYGGKTRGTKVVKIHAQKFFEFCKKLQAEFDPPVSLGRVMEGEVLSILKGASRRTRRTTFAKAGGKYNPSSKFYKGWVKMNGKKYYCGPTKNGLIGFRYSDAKWAQLQKRLKANRKRAETRVGLSKAVYYRVAHDLKLRRYSSGWEDETPIRDSYLKSGGMGSSGKKGPIWGTKQVAMSTKRLKGNKPLIIFNIQSTNTLNPFTRGVGALKGAIYARQKYFELAMEKGFTKGARNIAKHFPNIVVKKK